MLDRAVAGHVHHRAAVVQGAELVEGGERGAGVGRLVAQRPVELGGVADRLVDGEEEVLRVDHQVVAAGLDRWARRRARRAGTGSSATSASKSQPVPVRYSQPRPAGGRQRAHGREALRARRAPRSAGPGSGPAAGSSSCPPGWRSTCSPAPRPASALAWVTPVGGQQRLDQRQQPGLPLGLVDVERVDLVVRHPAGVGVHRLVGQLDPPRGQRLGHLRRGDGPLGEPGGAVGRQRRCRRRSPRRRRARRGRLRPRRLAVARPSPGRGRAGCGSRRGAARPARRRGCSPARPPGDRAASREPVAAAGRGSWGPARARSARSSGTGSTVDVAGDRSPLPPRLAAMSVAVRVIPCLDVHDGPGGQGRQLRRPPRRRRPGRAGRRSTAPRGPTS